jgi:hypothetical protein
METENSHLVTCLSLMAIQQMFNWCNILIQTFSVYLAKHRAEQWKFPSADRLADRNLPSLHRTDVDAFQSCDGLGVGSQLNTPS